MNHEKKPSDIEQLKQLLAKSFDGSEADDIPPLPEGLRDRIVDQYGQSESPARDARATGESFFSRISQFFQTPAYAAVTAVLILLLVATVVFNRPDRTAGQLRNGGSGEPTPLLTLVLYKLDEQTRAAVAEADFEGSAVTAAADESSLAAALEAGGTRIVIDGTAGKILGYLPGESDPAIEEPLPSDSGELIDKIADLQLRLDK